MSAWDSTTRPTWPARSTRTTSPAARPMCRPRRTATGGRCSDSAPVAVGDGIAPIAAERAPADPHPGGRLASLVFVALDQVEHPADGRTIEAAGLDLIHRQILLDERLENGIQHFVRRQ